MSMILSEIASLVRPNIQRLSPYSTARDEIQGYPEVFLDANENPYPNGWNRYPDPKQRALKEKIAAIKGCKVENIFLGNGSDEAIDLVFRVFCTPGEDNVVAITPSYGMYEVAASVNDIGLKTVQLNEDFSLPVERLLSACDHSTKVIFICSPNNPSGNAFTNKEIIAVLENFNGIVVVDEAYIDFCDQPSLVGKVEVYPNLIVLQTFSKARGLAALRLGMAFANGYTIRMMSMVKYPYNINEATQKLALEALEKPVDSQINEIIRQRSRICDRLESFSCVKNVYPSQANFLLVRVDDADRMYDHLIRNSIIVRNRSRMPGCAGCLRLTVGLPEENERLIKAIEAYEESNIRR